MAALDRRNPILDDFVGLNWSSWADHVANILSSEGLNVEECSKSGKKHTGTMTLGKEDMPIYGHSPTDDDFYLVVCSHCGQVVKPQAFAMHCERRHGPVTKLCRQYTTSAPEQRPRTGRSSSILSRSARDREKDGKYQGTGASLAALVVPRDKVQKEEVGVPSVDKFPQESSPSPTYSSAPCPRVSPCHTEPLLPGALSSSSEKPTQQKPVTRPSDEKPVTRPSDEKPVTRPSDEKPVTRPSDEKPVTRPSDEKPVTRPSDEKPVTRPSDEKPVTRPSDEKPVTRPSDEKPVTRPSDEKPVTRPSDEKPVTRPSDEKPVTRPSDEKPVTRPSDEKPVTRPSDEKPVTRPSDEKPVTRPSDEKPVTRPSDEKPVTRPSDEKPVTRPSDEKPVTRPSDEKPVTRPSDEKPVTRPSDEKPVTRTSDEKPVTRPSDVQHNPLPIPRTCSRTYKKVCKKECDLDKHCGVLDPERKRLCTRQLMCNIHSIHQRRKVVGRSKTFDQLVIEQRAGSKGQDPHALIDSPSHSEAPEEEPSPPQLDKRNRGSCFPILRHSPSRESLESNPDEEEEDGDGVVEVDIQPPYPFNQSLLLSEESEGEEQEEARDLPATPWHPKPLGLCTFGSHTLGCSIFTFGRRLHRLRFALSAMVEHHISAHLWKKIPQLSTDLRRHNTTSSSAARSSVRTGFRASPLTGSSLRCPPPTSLLHRAAGKDSCSSSSSGQSETQSCLNNPPASAKPPSSTLLSASHGRQRNPIGRPSKARLRELELLRAGGTVEKAAKPSHRCAEDQSSKHTREQDLHEKCQPPSSQGPINGTVSPRKKPCPSQPPRHRHSSVPGVASRSPFPTPFHPPHPSPRRRGRPPGVYGRLLGFDHRQLAKRRKTSDGSPPPNASLTRTPRSSTSNSSLFSWKGENMADVLSQGLEKTIDPQRTKLH